MNNYYFRLKKYNENQEPMCDILDAVGDAIPKMKFNKKYQLREIVQLVRPELWKSLSNFEARCVGYTFAGMVNSKFGDDLIICNPEQKPLKYIRLD